MFISVYQCVLHRAFTLIHGGIHSTLMAKTVGLATRAFHQGEDMDVVSPMVIVHRVSSSPTRVCDMAEGTRLHFMP